MSTTISAELGLVITVWHNNNTPGMQPPCPNTDNYDHEVLFDSKYLCQRQFINIIVDLFVSLLTCKFHCRFINVIVDS